MRKKYILAILALSVFTVGLTFPAFVFAGDVVVITHPDTAPGTVDADTIKKIYSGNVTRWPDGSRINLTMIENAPFHEDFLKTYVGKTKSQFQATWKKLMFTGKGKYPMSFNSAEELIDHISNNKGTIGYVSAGADVSKVSVQK